MATHRNGIIILNRPTENKYTEKKIISFVMASREAELLFHVKFDVTNVSFLETRTKQLFR